MLFSPEELKELEEESTQTVDVTEFVPIATIDPVYFDRAYYLGPEKGGDKAYRLLARALRTRAAWRSRSYAARGKQYLVMLRPGRRRDRHAAAALRGRGPADLGGRVGTEDVKDSEFKLAKMIVEQRATRASTPKPTRTRSRSASRSRSSRRSNRPGDHASPKRQERAKSSTSWKRSGQPRERAGPVAPESGVGIRRGRSPQASQARRAGRRETRTRAGGEEDGNRPQVVILFRSPPRACARADFTSFDSSGASRLSRSPSALRRA